MRGKGKKGKGEKGRGARKEGGREPMPTTTWSTLMLEMGTKSAPMIVRLWLSMEKVKVASAEVLMRRMRYRRP